MHIAVGLIGQIACIRISKDTDCVDGGSAVFKRFSISDSLICDEVVETIVVIRLAVSEKDNDLFRVLASPRKAIFAIHKALGMTHAVISSSGAIRLKIVDHILKFSKIDRKIAHDLRVVFSPRIVTDVI